MSEIVACAATEESKRGIDKHVDRRWLALRWVAATGEEAVHYRWVLRGRHPGWTALEAG